jgi:hypothetical protein
MKTRRPLFTVVLLLLAGMGALAWGIPAFAQISISAGGATASTTPGALSVAISGTVDGLPESVYISGLALISSKPVKDPDFGSKNVIVAIDLNVSAVGVKTGTKYVSDGQDSLVRQMALSDTVQITFPFYKSASGPAAARSAFVSFTLNYDTSGTLKSATAGLISNPNL